MARRHVFLARSQDLSPIMSLKSQSPAIAGATALDQPVPQTTSRWHVLAILSALMGFASISTDFYLPAMPQMAESLAQMPAASTSPFPAS